MVKKILLLIGLMGATLSGTCAVLTPQEALQRAKGGMQKVPKRVLAASPDPVFTGVTANEEAAVYVFASKDAAGYVVLSADDMAIPVLGYSDDQTFDAGNLPPQLEW